MNFSSLFPSIAVLNRYIPSLMKYHQVQFNKLLSKQMWQYCPYFLILILITSSAAMQNLLKSVQLRGSLDSEIVGIKNILYTKSIHIPRLCHKYCTNNGTVSRREWGRFPELPSHPSYSHDNETYWKSFPILLDWSHPPLHNFSKSFGKDNARPWCKRELRISYKK